MPQLDVTLLPSARASFTALVELLDWAEELDFAYAWIDTGAEESELWHALDERKIRRGVVGLHFAGTDPAALAFFLDTAPEQVRVVLDTEGTFHPKVIVGVRGKARRAIVGSSNFTPSGFGPNTELNVLVSGGAEDRFFQELDAEISDFWFRGEALTAEFIEDYRQQWKRRPRPRRLRGRRAGLPSAPKAASDLEVGWDQYVRLLRKQDKRGVHVISRNPDLETYVRESETAREVLRAAGSFAALSYEDARYVSGFGPGVGYFGSTRPNGVFMRMVKSDPARIAPLVDPIRESGSVPDDVVRSVFEHAEGIPQLAIGVVTRFLTMKRPDLFFPINNANSRGIRELLGSVPKDADTYLEMVHAIRRLPWARSPRPRDPTEGRLWDARVGLLDAVVYEPARRS